MVNLSWVKYEGNGKDYGRFVAEPLEKGYGITLGNSLRRILLSSLEGASISAVQIEGVSHEFEQIEGVVEDTLDIILNIKGIIVKSHSEEEKEMKISFQGPGEITAANIEHDDEIEVISTGHHICTVSEKKNIEIKFWVKQGKGYVLSRDNKDNDKDVNVIFIDSNFSPITKVNLNVENTRVGNRTDFDKLTMDVWTNGSENPESAVKKSADILIKNFNMFIDYNQKPEALEEVAEEDSGESTIDLTVEDLELSARSSNCLKKAGIDAVSELLEKDMKELMQIKNFGKKSADEINEKLAQYGLKLKDEDAEE